MKNDFPQVVVNGVAALIVEELDHTLASVDTLKECLCAIREREQVTAEDEWLSTLENASVIVNARLEHLQPAHAEDAFAKNYSLKNLRAALTSVHAEHMHVHWLGVLSEPAPSLAIPV